MRVAIAEDSVLLREGLARLLTEAEFEVVVIVQAKSPPSVTAANEGGWPAGYFDLAGSINDETFVRHPQGELPKPVDFG